MTSITSETFLSIQTTDASENLATKPVHTNHTTQQSMETATSTTSKTSTTTTTIVRRPTAAATTTATATPPPAAAAAVRSLTQKELHTDTRPAKSRGLMRRPEPRGSETENIYFAAQYRALEAGTRSA